MKSELLYATVLYPMLLLFVECLAQGCPDNCSYTQWNISCNWTFPCRSLANISMVYLYGIDFQKFATDPPFNKSSWINVTHLFVDTNIFIDGKETPFTESFILKSKTFYYLQNLKYLKFSSKRLHSMETGALFGLESLAVLDLSNNLEIVVDVLVQGLTGNTFPNLKSLHLGHLSRLSSLAPFFTHTFFNIFKDSPLETLDLSNTNYASMDAFAFSVSFPYLHTLNFERGGYLAVNLLLALRNNPNGVTFKNLKHINVNYPYIPEAVMAKDNIADLTDVSSYGRETSQNFTELHLRACAPSGYITRVIGLITNNSLWVSMHFTNNNITWAAFNLKLDVERKIPLKILDIAENGIEDLDESLTEVAPKLQYLDVSRNRLFMMQQHKLEKMFHNFTYLEELYCSYNELYELPDVVFQFSLEIKIIDLSFNNLQAITFNIFHLNKLQLLNLTHNDFAIIDPETLSKLDNFFQLALQNRNDSASSSSKSSKLLQIFLDLNPLDCTCKGKEFVRWLIYTEIVPKSVFLQCLANSQRERIEEGALEKIEHLCELPVIYLSVGICSGIFCVLLIVFGTIIIRQQVKRRRKRLPRKIFSKYKANEERAPWKYPVFLSYCSADSEFVLERVFPTVSEKLKMLLHSSDECVATGDMSFTPGFHIADEIVKCIERSCVVLFCVSRQFCASAWCNDEVIAAHIERKPIILMFLEHVETKSMPKQLQKQFMVKTRATWSLNQHGEKVLSPNMDTLCEAIVRLMGQAMSRRDKDDMTHKHAGEIN